MLDCNSNFMNIIQIKIVIWFRSGKPVPQTVTDLCKITAKFITDDGCVKVTFTLSHRRICIDIRLELEKCKESVQN